MKPYIVQLEIDDRKSIVYCKDGTIYRGRCIGDCIVTNVLEKHSWNMIRFSVSKAE